jgi:hypothetical protein
MKKILVGSTLGALLALGTAGSLQAQIAATPRALGMAGAFDGLARGQEAIFLNPALLGLAGTPYWSAAFPQVTVGGTMVGAEIGDLQTMTKYRRISQEDRDAILGRVHPDGTEGRYQLRAPAFALQAGRFGFAVSYASVGGHTISRDVMELFFDGYEEGRTDYGVGNTSGSRATYWDIAAAYGRSIGPLSIGATGHFYRGGTLVRSRLLEPRVDVVARDIEVEYRAVLARGGTGYGLDLGAAYQPIHGVSLSASVSNVVSSMAWNEDLRLRRVTLDRNDIENVSAMDLLTRYETSETTGDPGGTTLADLAVVEGLFEESDVPSVLRLGASWSAVTGTDLGISYREELTASRLGEVWDRSVAVGVQQRIPFATLRAGYATNMDGGSMISGGLGLGVLQLGAARLQDGDLDGFDRSGWVGTFGVSVRTTGSLR